MIDQTPHIGIFITYEEVTGRRARMADAIHLLSRLNIHSVLQMIATLNATLVDPFDSKDQIRNLQSVLVRRLFNGQLRRALKSSKYGTDSSVAVFHRQQQLIMLRLALMACPTDGGQVWDEQASHWFGEASLMVNDFAGYREEELPGESLLLDVATRLLPIGELPSDSHTAGLVGRSYEMWLQIPKGPMLHSEKDYVPISTRFHERYNISLEHFVQGLFLILLKTESFNPHIDNALDAIVINSKTYLQNVSFPEEAFQKILDIVSCKLSELKDKVVTEPVQNARFDFTLLRRYPLVEVEPNIYICHDLGFFRKFFTDGIYWQIHEALTEDEQPKFRSFYGKVFATYVEDILSHVYKVGPNSSTHLVRPKLVFSGNQGEVCDYFIKNGDAWVVMETKAALLTTRGKYSGLSHILEQELQSKFVLNPQNKNKGVGQLANSIKKLMSGVPTTAHELQIGECRRIYPVLISYDSALVSPGIPQYLESQFQAKLGQMPIGPKVMPLTVLSANDVEVLTTVKNKHDISALLSTYHHYRAPAETLAGFISRYYYYKTDLMLSRFYDSFVALSDDIKPYFK